MTDNDDIVSRIKGMKWEFAPFPLVSLSLSPQDVIFERTQNVIDQLIWLSFDLSDNEAVMIEKQTEITKDIVLANFIATHPEAQINGAGEVALYCTKRGQHLITGCPSGKEYVATTEADICLVWVDPGDVDFIIENKKMGCCGKPKQKVFSLANETQVRRHLNKGGR